MKYCLRIHVLPQNYTKISESLKIVPNDIYGWAYTFNDKETDYMNVIENVITNFSLLNEIEQINDKIEFWIYYEYDDQCNLEFGPILLEKLSLIGCTLCISCWNKN